MYSVGHNLRLQINLLIINPPQKYLRIFSDSLKEHVILHRVTYSYSLLYYFDSFSSNASLKKLFSLPKIQWGFQYKQTTVIGSMCH